MNDFLIGGVIGISQVIIGHPLDTIKTTIQSKQPIKTFSIPRLYRGVIPPMVSNSIINSSVFGLNNFFQKATKNQYFSGFASGLISTVIINPFEVVKIQQQNLSKLPFKPLRGFGITAARESLAFSAYFGIYHDIHDTGLHPAISGGIAGWSGWFLTYPIDVIKSRVQYDYCLTILDAYKMGNLWKGFGICSGRAVLVNGFSFYLYDKLRN